MSYKEAQEDGITTRRTGCGDTVYYPPCHICGQPTFSRNYIRENKYTCKNCKSAALIRKAVNKTA